MPEGVYLVEGVDECVQCTRVREGTEILGAVLHDEAGLEEAGVSVVRYPHDGVGLPVLQVYVVAGGIFLYQVVLEQERLILVVRRDVLDAPRPRDQEPGLDVLARVEIRRETALEVFRLADVEDCPRCVLPHIDPAQLRGLERCLVELLSYLGGGKRVSLRLFL